MFADRGRKPKLLSETHARRPPLKHTQLVAPALDKRPPSKSPSTPRLSSLSPHHKRIKKASTRLFEAAHLPLSGETYLLPQPSRGTEVRRIVRAFSN